MTPSDVDAALPNGFHDAFLRELHVDFARQEARLAFDFLVGIPEADTEEGREAMRPGILRLSGVTSMAVEPPDPRYTLSGELWAKLPGETGWRAFPTGTAFEVPGRSAFDVKASFPSAYLCEYL